MSEKDSFQRAVYEGRITGPEWCVVSSDTGEGVICGEQDFGHMSLGRAVKTTSGSYIGHVIDFQHPVDTPAAERDPDFGYDFPAQDPRFRDA